MTPEEPKNASAADEVRPFVQRMTGSLQLQGPVYDEIAADPDATNQAAVVVAITALAQALGGPERIPMEDMPLALAWAYFSWLVPGALVWVVGNRFLGTNVDLPRVLRCTGYATSPQILWLLGLASLDSAPFELALGVLIFGLSLVANVIAIRQAFAVTTIRAVQAFLLGFLAFAGVAVVVGFIFAQLSTRL
ncbi:MAG: YIP1 family protein [Candidatus Binatia bacterium]|nr:YIP1 family protein [Candidatus Binatia bacterium]